MNTTVTSTEDKAKQDFSQLKREIDLKALLLEIYYNKWLFLLIMGISLLGAVYYLLPIPTQYQTTALIQVENKQSGIEEAIPGLGLTGGAVNAMSTSIIESMLMQSRYILEPTVQRHNLDLSVTPHYFPVIGAYMARNYDKHNNNHRLAKSFFGLSKYAWGGETLKVEQFNLPDSLVGQVFILVAEKENRYRLCLSNGDIILRGQGTSQAYSDPKVLPGISIKISELRARQEEQFYITKSPIEGIVKALTQALNIQDAGKEKQMVNVTTGILTLTLTGTEASQLPEILNTIIDFEIQKNIEKKSREIKQILDFLQTQLPIIKNTLDKAETSLSDYRARTHTFGLSAEASLLLKQLTQVEELLEQLKLKKAELLFSFTESHPAISAINQQSTELRSQLELLREKISLLPESEQKVLGLERDIRVKSQLYLMLLTKIQQLQVSQAGTISDVRVLGKANYVTVLPSKNKVTLLGALFFGFLLSVLVIFIRKIFIHNVDDPDYVEEQLNIPAYAIIPHSRTQEKIQRELKMRVPGKTPCILAERQPKDTAIEGVRSLRTAVQFALLEASNNRISILGASPSIGKSFVTVNLGYVFADSGKRVLIIDADMRKGKLHKYFKKQLSPGLSEILNASVAIEQAIQKIKPGQIDFVASGHYPKNPSELLLSTRFNDFLNNMSQLYDVILLDTPPLLAVTDSALIAKYTGINLLIIGSDKNNLKEMEHVVKRFRKSDVEINGLVFNNTTKRQLGYGYGYYNYYYYNYENKRKEKV